MEMLVGLFDSLDEARAFALANCPNSAITPVFLAATHIRALIESPSHTETERILTEAIG